MATSRKEHLATVLMHSSESTSDAMAVHSSFPTTQWTTLLDPIKGRGQGFDCALNQLCRFYRPPIVAFIRGWGYDPNTAEDLAHDFIARLLRLDELTKVDRTKGRFRSFVCASLRHFLHNYNKAKHAWKRGGRAEHISLEGLAVDPPSPTNAETEFNHCWAQSVADEGLRRLSAEWADRGKSIEFADYQDFIFAKKIGVERSQLAAKHSTTVGGVDVTIHRLRKRYAAHVRDLIAATVSSPAEVQEELRHLLAHINR